MAGGLTIIATPSALDANSYMTVQEMSDALEGRHPLTIMDAWDELQNDAQCALLVRGSKLINQYPRGGWGPRKVDEQSMNFPRVDDLVDAIPQKVKDALLEYVALELEDEGEMAALKKLQAEGITSANILGQSIGQEKDVSHLPAGARQPLDQLIASHWPEAAVKNPKLLGDENFDFFG